jgi:DUF438 domain-containing protein
MHSQQPVAFLFNLDEDMDTSQEFLAFKAENSGPKHQEFHNRHEPWDNSLIQFDLFGPDGELVRETVRFNWQDYSCSSFMSHMIIDEEFLPAGEYRLVVDVYHWDNTFVDRNEEYGRIIVDLLSYRNVNFRQE